MAPNRRKSMARWLTVAAALLAVCRVVPATETEETVRVVDERVLSPLHERLSYSVSWAGIHCGKLEINSFREVGPGGETIDRIAVLMRTTRFFDGIYRVRSRLDSFFDPTLMSSVRYEEQSQEKKKRKHEVWVVDHEGGEVVRTKNGETSRIPLESGEILDPLVFIFRLRNMGLEVGSEASLDLMTSKGAVRAVVRAAKRKHMKTKSGPCDATAIVPEVMDAMMFSNSGGMVVWIDQTAPNRPCRIDFDLSFGKLVANLKAFEDVVEGDEIEDWETWGE